MTEGSVVCNILHLAKIWTFLFKKDFRYSPAQPPRVIKIVPKHWMNWKITRLRRFTVRKESFTPRLSDKLLCV